MTPGVTSLLSVFVIKFYWTIATFICLHLLLSVTQGLQLGLYRKKFSTSELEQMSSAGKVPGYVMNMRWRGRLE